jgi:rhodanese-related sulfurtransferase
MSVQTITPQSVRQQLQDGDRARLVDVRTPAEYERVHATGAESIPLDQLDTTILAEKRTENDQNIFVICHGGSRSAKACEKLLAGGMSKVYSVAGGTAAWEAAGLPVERGASTVISLERQVRIAAGSLVVLGTLLGLAVHRAFLGLPLFVGAGLVFAGLSDFCGMALLLAKMPWNNLRESSCRQTGL